MSNKFDFIRQTRQQEELTYNPPEKTTNFYQVCIFPDPWTNKYSIRKIKFDQNGNCIKISEYKVNKDKYKKFANKYKSHEYKSYSTYTLDEVKLPNGGEMLTAESSLLNDNYNDLDNYYRV